LGGTADFIAEQRFRDFPVELRGDVESLAFGDCESASDGDCVVRPRNRRALDSDLSAEIR